VTTGEEMRMAGNEGDDEENAAYRHIGFSSLLSAP